MSYEQLVDLLQSVEQITTVPISVPGGREEVTGKPTCQPTSSAVSEPSKMEGSVIGKLRFVCCCTRGGPLLYHWGKVVYVYIMEREKEYEKW